MRRIEALEIVGDEGGERQVRIADALDDALRELEGAVIIVVGGVLAVLIEGDGGAPGTERLVKPGAHPVEIDERDACF